MSRILKQMQRDFKRILNLDETPSITIDYTTRTGGTTKIGYGTVSGATEEKHSKTVKAVVTNVDEWSIKRLPYADLQVGNTVFYVSVDLDLKDAEDIKVSWGGRVIPVVVRPATPIGSTYLAQALVPAKAAK